MMLDPAKAVAPACQTCVHYPLCYVVWNVGPRDPCRFIGAGSYGHYKRKPAAVHPDKLIDELETQSAVMREALRYVEGELLARQYAAGEVGIYRRELERIESALKREADDD